MPHANRAGIPAPSITGLVEPASVVIRRPAPRVVAYPRPSIPVFPNPASGPVRRPTRRHGRLPHVAVGRHVHPVSIRVQVLCAIYARRNILLADGSGERAVAAVAPAVPFV